MNFPAGAVSRDKLIAPAAIGADAARAPRPIDPVAGSLPFARFREQSDRIDAWNRIETAATLPTQSPAFAAALASTLAAEADLRIYFVESGDGIAALFPLSLGPGPFGRLKVAGEEQLCEPGEILCGDADGANRLAEAIVREKRIVDLDRIPAHSPLVPALREASRGKGLFSVRPAVPTPTISLDSGWKDPASRFNSGRRSDFRRASRKAGDLGEVAFEMLSPSPDEFDSLFDEAIGVEARSWKSEVGTAIAVDRCKERFFREYFRSASERGEFRLAFMRIDGEVVAMQMALECLDRYWLFKIGFDEAFARCSPGTLLMLDSLGWAAKRGLRSYELLGNVEPWIATFWTRERHDYVRLRFYPFNLRGSVALAGDFLVWLGKAFRRGGR